MRQIIDEQIVSKAKRRVGFKIHFTVFFLALPINWIIWYFTNRTYVWPIRPTLGWEMGIFIHYVGVYHSDKFFSVDVEVTKLREKSLGGR